MDFETFINKYSFINAKFVKDFYINNHLFDFN